MRRALAIVLAVHALSGCAIPPRPTYDDACVQSDSFFVDLARERTDLVEVGDMPTDPAAALAEALAETEALGLEVERKAAGDSRWAGFTTTLPGIVLLEADWDTKPVAEQAAVIKHENVHGRQYARLGARRFGAIYVVPEGRWALEVAAHVQSFLVLAHLGEAPDIEATAAKLRSSYLLDAMPSCTVETTVEIWREALEDAA